MTVSAATLGRLAFLAYVPGSLELLPDGWKAIPFEYREASGLWCSSNELEVDVVAIAGTNEPNDWLQNLDDELVDVDGVGVRRGFKQHAEQLRVALESVDFFERWRRYPLTIVGHSLGGAAAGILPLLTGVSHLKRIATFGAPRFLHYETAHKYPLGDITTRYVRTMDWVPDVPFRPWFRGLMIPDSGWCHDGRVVWLHDNSRPTIDPSPLWQGWRRMKRAAKYALQFGRWSQVIRQDHDIAEYARLCRHWGI